MCNISFILFDLSRGYLFHLMLEIRSIPTMASQATKWAHGARPTLTGTVRVHTSPCFPSAAATPGAERSGKHGNWERSLIPSKQHEALPQQWLLFSKLAAFCISTSQKVNKQLSKHYGSPLIEDHKRRWWHALSLLQSNSEARQSRGHGMWDFKFLLAN